MMSASILWLLFGDFLRLWCTANLISSQYYRQATCELRMPVALINTAGDFMCQNRIPRSAHTEKLLLTILEFSKHAPLSKYPSPKRLLWSKQRHKTTMPCPMYRTKRMRREDGTHKCYEHTRLWNDFALSTETVRVAHACMPWHGY